MDLESIDRSVVRQVLSQYAPTETAAQLVALGYDKEMVREEHSAAVLAWIKRLADSAEPSQEQK